MKRLLVAIRLFLTAVLLYVVWRNAHWSVALTLTGLAIASELIVAGLNLRRTN